VVIVDSSVLIDYIGGFLTPQTRWLGIRRGLEPMGITTTTMTEVLQGLRSDRVFEAAAAALNGFTVFATITPELAVAAAGHYRTLRSEGITIRSTIDTLIATFCIRENFRLLHCDADFVHFERHFGLLVVDPTIVPFN
jgi:predicted nucleic acid-binding protein